MKNTVNDLDLERFILVADRGMYSGTNICYVINNNNGYIVSKSIKKSKKSDRQWIINQEGYIEESPDFKYKSRIVRKVPHTFEVDLELKLYSISDLKAIKKSVKIF